jgi:hypothetical protein
MLQPMSIGHAFPQPCAFETASRNPTSTCIAPTKDKTSGHDVATRRVKKMVVAKGRESEECRNGTHRECFRNGLSNLRVEDLKRSIKSVMCDSPKRKKGPEAERRKAEKVRDQRRHGSKMHRVEADGEGSMAARHERTRRPDKKLARKVPATNLKISPDDPLGPQSPLHDSRSSKSAMLLKHAEPAMTCHLSSRGPECRSPKAPSRGASSIGKPANTSKRRKSSKCVHSATDQAAIVSDSSASDLSKSSPARRRREHAPCTRYFWKDPGLSRPTTPKGILKKSCSGEL